MSTHETVVNTPDGSSPKTLKTYVVGFTLCVILTVIPFFLVAKHALSVKALFVTLSICAVLQLLVQVIFFLRLNASKEGRWNLMPFLFTVFIVLVLVIGSLWIMWNLNYNMMH